MPIFSDSLGNRDRQRASHQRDKKSWITHPNGYSSFLQPFLWQVPSPLQYVVAVQSDENCLVSGLTRLLATLQAPPSSTVPALAKVDTEASHARPRDSVRGNIVEV